MWYCNFNSFQICQTADNEIKNCYIWHFPGLFYGPVNSWAVSRRMNDVMERKQWLCLIFGLSQYLPTGTEENNENRSQDSLGPRWDSHQATPEYTPKSLPLDQPSICFSCSYSNFFTGLKLYLHRRELTISEIRKSVFFSFAAEELQSGHEPLRCGASPCH
jgi:hypothetical protein